MVLVVVTKKRRLVRVIAALRTSLTPSSTSEEAPSLAASVIIAFRRARCIKHDALRCLTLRRRGTGTF